MYVPTAFAEQRLEVLHAFIRGHSFATVVTAGGDGPVASHVPVLLLPASGPFGSLQFHLARQNEQAEALASGAAALVIFHGPHAYISPRWYAAEVAVPTWNYVSVHARGTPRSLDDRALIEHLRSLSATHEPEGPAAWSPDRLPAETAAKLRGSIVAFEIVIERIEGKWKLGQNRAAADVRGAVEGLRASADPDAAKIADLMEAASRRGGSYPRLCVGQGGRLGKRRASPRLPIQAEPADCLAVELLAIEPVVDHRLDLGEAGLLEHAPGSRVADPAARIDRA
jgi:transcriptional regulator